MKTMSTKTLLLPAGLVLAFTACILPPAALERAGWAPADPWQSQGRYRTAEDPAAAAEREQAAANERKLAATPVPAPTTCTEPQLEGANTPATGAPGGVVQKPPLYAWDGGVVDGAPAGRVAEEDATRGLETPPAGRMHIIELYQQVLDERDALAEEVELLRKNLDQTNTALEAKTKEASDLGAQLAALEASHRDLTAENQSIAARLVQAQIRRLEAEKMLLETRIEVERAKAEEAALAAAAQSKATKAKAPKKEPPDGGAKDE